ncbi:MAG TPA: DUF167 domain-containing protein [Candidatus Paceibacterota bacterium]
MKIFVKAKAGARENKVVPPVARLLPLGDDEEEFYSVSVKEPPRQGKANEAIMKALAEYFKVSFSEIRLVSGASSKKKVFEIKNQ